VSKHLWIKIIAARRIQLRCLFQVRRRKTFNGTIYKLKRLSVLGMVTIPDQTCLQIIFLAKRIKSPVQIILHKTRRFREGITLVYDPGLPENGFMYRAKGTPQSTMTMLFNVSFTALY
jgi:hypothetical protein